MILPARGLGKPHFLDSQSDRVYLYSGGNGIISVRLDGTDRREHLHVKGKGHYAATEPVSARDVQLSPNGNWALSSVQNQLYLLAVPKVGGPAPIVNVNSPSVPVKKLTDIGADYYGWGESGKTVTWSIGSTFYSMPVDSLSYDEIDKEKTEGTEDD